MNSSNKIELGSVQKTLLLPLWGRAIETKKRQPLLVDEMAVSIIDKLNFDFGAISNNVSKLSQASWIARSLYFDEKIKDFMTIYPEATIVNVGCGLDTTFDRVDNGTIQWIDLDLSDTIVLRKKFISETERRKFISSSVLDTDWYKHILNPSKVMLLIAGVLYYFEETEVKQLFSDFHTFIPGAELVFDYSSTRGIKIANKKVIKNGGMDKEASLKWGIDSIFEIEKWNRSIKVKCTMPMFQEHKMHFQLSKRIGMNISDMLKIMSLAHVKID
jgi:O-methyltransferase involved in polyketide biosynthesis